MKQKTAEESVRFSPIALALVLFVVLGLLAVTVRAQETGDDILPKSTQNDTEIGNENLFGTIEQQNGPRGGKTVPTNDFVLDTPISSASGEPARIMYKEGDGEDTPLFSSVRAQIRSERTEQKNRIAEIMEERRAVRLNRSEEHKARLQVDAQARLSAYAERIVSRMDATLNRLTTIAERVEAKVDEMEEDGEYVLSARQAIENVYLFIADACEYVVLVGEASVETFASEDPLGDKELLRESIELAKEGIREVHLSLSETVQEIKSSLSVEESVEQVKTVEDFDTE